MLKIKSILRHQNHYVKKAERQLCDFRRKRKLPIIALFLVKMIND